MKRHLQFYLQVALAIVLFDVVASLASRNIPVDYSKFFWVSWGIYLASGFLGCKRLGFAGGIFAGLVAGFADATLGWFLSTVIGPYIPGGPPQVNSLMIAIIIVVVSVFGTVSGLIGAVLFKLLTKIRS